MSTQPWRGERGDVTGRPPLALPPERMPALCGGRPLKRWTWIGAFGPDVMLCVARARIGPVTAAWWAVWDREAQRLTERSLRRGGGIEVSARHARVPGAIELELGDAAAVEVVSPHGGQYAWTRKRGGVRVRGTVTAGGRELAIDAAGVVDESAGYHARHTAWRWSAGVGVAETGEPVAWNLVAGLHDAPAASERTVWVSGAPHEVGPVAFDGLAGVAGLRFAAEATRARRENLLVMASDYEQPFGTFTGEVGGSDGPVRLREGWGVMERHDVRW